jgi:hypothetical protein
LEDFYNTLGHRFIAGGDYNAKNTDLRIQTRYTRGHDLSMGEPTYWPSDRNKPPDLVDFCVTKGTPQDFAVAKIMF